MSLAQVSRPGFIELLQNLKSEGHTLSLWTSSPRPRTEIILDDLKLREFFGTVVCREEYDPKNLGVGKDIAKIKGDFLIDDDPSQVEYAASIGKKAFLISPYRRNTEADPAELKRLLRAIKLAQGLVGMLRSLFK